MKTYVKPTVDVVELSVKENMAVLPQGVQTTIEHGTYGVIETTVYDLTAVASSDQI